MIKSIYKKIKRKVDTFLNRFKYKELRKLRARTQKFGDDSNWIISLEDLIALDKIIKKHNIKNILELGAGIGNCTLGMVWSLPDGGHIYAVEQFAKCTEIAKEMIPEKYKKKITFHQSDVEITEPFKYINTISYKNLPKGDWDLIVIDGPSFLMEGENLITSLPRGDIMKLVDTIKDGTLIYIDGSRITNKLLKRFYSHCFDYKDGLYKKIKSDKPRDSKLEKFKKWGFV